MSPKCARTRCTGTLEVLEVSGSFPSFDISCNVCGAVHVSYYSRKLAEQELSYIEDDRRDEEQKQADTDAELARLRAELAAVTQERDEALKRRDFAVAGEENIRYLKQLWEQECGYYRAKWWEADQANDRSRRTIAALVVAARALWFAGYFMAPVSVGEFVERTRGIVRVQKAEHNTKAVRRAGE